MEKSKNAVTLVGTGIVIGAALVWFLMIYFGARPTKLTVGPLEFELSTAVPIATPTSYQNLSTLTIQLTSTPTTISNVAPATLTSTATPSPTLTPNIRIIEPEKGASVVQDQIVLGTVSNLPNGAVVWIFTGQFIANESRPRYWVQRSGAITPSQDGTWRGTAYFDNADIGHQFEITAVVADASINTYLQEYIASVDRNYPVPFLGFPPLKAFFVWDTINVTRR